MTPSPSLPRKPFRLGFLAFVEHTGVSGTHSRGLREGLELFKHAEELGFDSGWVRHRHLEKYLSSPLTFLTAVAQHTSQIRLGTSVIPLRYEHPIRLAEDAATADLLTDGRLELGLSSGYSGPGGVSEKVYGAIEGSLRSVVDERLERFRSALRGETLAIADETFPLAEPGTELTVQPLSPTLAERLYYGAGAAESAERTGKQGLRLQLSTLNTAASELSFEEAQLDSIQRYRAAHAAVSDRPSFAAVSRQVLPILNAEDAENFAWLLERDATRQREYGTPGASPFQFGKVPSGTPESIAEWLAADVALKEADELMIALPFDQPAPVLHRLLSLIATEVAPALGWTPHASPRPGAAGAS